MDEAFPDIVSTDTKMEQQPTAQKSFVRAPGAGQEVAGPGGHTAEHKHVEVGQNRGVLPQSWRSSVPPGEKANSQLLLGQDIGHPRPCSRGAAEGVLAAVPPGWDPRTLDAWGPLRTKGLKPAF